MSRIAIFNESQGNRIAATVQKVEQSPLRKRAAGFNPRFNGGDDSGTQSASGAPQYAGMVFQGVAANSAGWGFLSGTNVPL